MVAHQVAEFVSQQVCCPDCGRPRLRKGRHQLFYRTLFGKLRLGSQSQPRRRLRSPRFVLVSYKEPDMSWPWPANLSL
ncbi:hypothetical protein V5E97_07420 [Singulisphaera sp. Ch08]|uniref:Transposase n=1 Tax=Singulisphaera sp. Ch08 TaxID=3120278 RepID=A0AAU7CL21_9BACT